MTSRGARAARGTAVAVFATFVASLAHTVGGGGPPGSVAVVVALAFSVPLAVALTDARARLVRTAVSALIAQAALHLCYAMGAAAPVVAGSSATHAGHDAGAHLSVSSVATVDHGNAWMPVAHLVAAAITLAALMLADRFVDTVARVIRVLVRWLTVIPAPVAVRSLRVPVDGPRSHLVAVLLASGLGSRGPPVEVAAA
ncbi:hypothetical protein [Agromyces sp. Soil535]|uniref:hypothetical protein n=1 Tax=Agromyces sp. Soil535 TaxID=1736390 RepID=UPI0012E3BBDB|nr:hypothetical protein [Agromyces sp. Soil535]